MLSHIERWIDETNQAHEKHRFSCSVLSGAFDGFYPHEFLKSAYFVITDSIPKPNFAELSNTALRDFLVMDVDGITYKNTYYVTNKKSSDLALHFHELVHVIQWRKLGALGFLKRYINEIESCGYDDAPLELMAYDLQHKYESKANKFNIVSYVHNQM